MPWPLYMDAEIKPHRSLSQRGAIVLIAVITAVNVASALVFLRMGAMFVPVFMAIDVVAVLVALVVSFRAARIVERIQITASDVVVSQETPNANHSRVVWESPTAFTRVTAERDEEDRVTAVRLALSGRQATVAAALSPRERGEFLKALEAAIWRAKRGDRAPA